jgi:hypothetical protein
MLLNGSNAIVSHIVVVATDKKIKVYFNQFYNIET